MAFGTVLLPISAAVPPDASGTNNNPPAIQRVRSTGADPKPFFLQAAFDASTQEALIWSFRMPSDFTSNPVLKVQYKMASAVTGNVIIESRVSATTPGDTTDTDAKTFSTVNTSAATAVPATTAGKIGEISLSLANSDSLAANDYVSIYLARDADNAGDTATGDMEVVAVSLEYTI